MKSTSGDCSLLERVFAAAYPGTGSLRVKGIDDGVAVVGQKLDLDNAATFAHFKNAFTSTDKATFRFVDKDIAV